MVGMPLLLLLSKLIVSLEGIMEPSLGSQRVLGQAIRDTSTGYGYLHENRLAGIMRSKSLGL